MLVYVAAVDAQERVTMIGVFSSAARACQACEDHSLSHGKPPHAAPAFSPWRAVPTRGREVRRLVGGDYTVVGLELVGDSA